MVASCCSWRFQPLCPAAGAVFSVLFIEILPRAAAPPAIAPPRPALSRTVVAAPPPCRIRQYQWLRRAPVRFEPNDERDHDAARMVTLRHWLRSGGSVGLGGVGSGGGASAAAGTGAHAATPGCTGRRPLQAGRHHLAAGGK